MGEGVWNSGRNGGGGVQGDKRWVSSPKIVDKDSKGLLGKVMLLQKQSHFREAHFPELLICKLKIRSGTFHKTITYILTS
jgi:hypothetical protein